jgi:hypothetical protein
MLRDEPTDMVKLTEYSTAQQHCLLPQFLWQRSIRIRNKEAAGDKMSSCS